jgi:hypothetical protein
MTSKPNGQSWATTEPLAIQQVDQRDPNAPDQAAITMSHFGFKTYLEGKRLVIRCGSCGRRWKAEGIVKEENRDWLMKHRDEHAHAQAVAAFVTREPL